MEQTYAWYRACRPSLSDPKMSRIEETLRFSGR